MTLQDWRLLEEFTTNANRLREIFFDLPEKSKLSIEELEESAQSDELFNFILLLLIEEFKCRTALPIDFNVKYCDDFCGIVSWFNQVLAGLISDPFPTVEYLLKEQNRPSIYCEFDGIFAATKLLNAMASIYDPNAERIDASHLFNVCQFETYKNLSKDLKSLIDSVFIVKVPVDSEAPFAQGPSFRFELLNYVDFDCKTEFKSIPIELLDVNEGSDIGAPFGKRWSRRVVAKSSAYDKINFNLLKLGRFPAPIPKSLESITMNFDVQLPESIGIELLHQNIFDNSFLSAEFLDYSAFAIHFAKFLKEIPAVLTQKLKNTDIFAHAPLRNPSKTGSKASLASFRALLLVSGLRGHLNSETLPPVDIHEILNFDSEGTSSCLLLALALSNLKCPPKNGQSKFLNKLFSMHLPSFQSSLGLEIPPILQLSATLSLGIFKFKSQDRGTAQLLLKEIFRPLRLNVNAKPIEDTPLFSIVPAFTLGMCLMGSAASKNLNDAQFANDIQVQLYSNLLINGNKTLHRISVLIASAFINIGNREFDASTLPWSRSLPDLLDKPDNVIFWTFLTWRLSQWDSEPFCSLDDQAFDKVKINFLAVFESVCTPQAGSVWTDSSELGLLSYACQVLIANSVYSALKLAGSQKSFKSLDFWIDKLSSYPILRNTDSDYFMTKIQSLLMTTLQYLLLCKCLIFVGSGDPDCWALLRKFWSDPLTFNYGIAKLFYSSIGFLFAGKGRLTIKTEIIKNDQKEIDHLSVASLLCSIVPILPSSPVDSELSFVTLMDTLWPLSLKTI